MSGLGAAQTFDTTTPSSRRSDGSGVSARDAMRSEGSLPHRGNKAWGDRRVEDAGCSRAEAHPLHPGASVSRERDEASGPLAEVVADGVGGTDGTANTSPSISAHRCASAARAGRCSSRRRAGVRSDSPHAADVRGVTRHR